MLNVWILFKILVIFHMNGISVKSGNYDLDSLYFLGNTIEEHFNTWVRNGRIIGLRCVFK